MSTPVNYYMAVRRGVNNNPGSVTFATTTQGASADVELRMQIDNGTSTTGLTIMDVMKILELFEQTVVQRGITGNLGLDLPAN